MNDGIISSLNPGLHMVVTITEHVCHYVTKWVLKLLKYQLHICLVKDHYLESLQLYQDQLIPEQLKKRARRHVLPILTTSMETRL